jgi:hypothetical protein
MIRCQFRSARFHKMHRVLEIVEEMLLCKKLGKER